ncbi:MAG TPA: energy transducer TonB [Terracidiphilus sp.]|jgi:protein TonB
MFEDSTFESAGKIHTRSRTWGLVAFAFNTLILAALVAIPLIYPEALPGRFINMLLTAPPPAPEVPKPIQQQPQAQAFHGQRELVGLNLTAPRHIPGSITKFSGPERDPGIGPAISMDSGIGFTNGDPFAHSGARQPVVVQERRGPVTISRGVAEGMLIQRVIPHYPPIAQATRTQGTVVLQATVAKDGVIRDLHVVSGSPMLQQAALEAVSQWRYRPYLLSGQPVEVETTINVVFSLNQ